MSNVKEENIGRDGTIRWIRGDGRIVLKKIP